MEAQYARQRNGDINFRLRRDDDTDTLRGQIDDDEGEFADDQ